MVCRSPGKERERQRVWPKMAWSTFHFWNFRLL